MSNEINLQLTIAASPQDVYRALVEGEQLQQWFAEHADVSLDDNRYAFWGQLTPETPDKTVGQHKLLSADPDEGLKFEWRFRGADTTVTIDLKEEGPHTMVKLVHFGLPVHQHGQFAVADFWDLCMENLRTWVERQEVNAQCNFGTVHRGEVQLDIDIDGSLSDVFDTLMNPETLKRYMGQDPVVEAEVGGKYSFGWEAGGPVKILELESDKKLKYTWGFENEPQDTVVTWTLEGSGGKTRLTLVHSGFAPDRNMEDYQVGWLKFMQRIKLLVELGDGWEKPLLTSSEFSD